mgnify:FL=1
MFSVYGKAGRVFRGAMEELRQVGRVGRSDRAQAVFPVGFDPHDQNPALPVATESPPRDTAHRTAMAAYADVAHPHLPRQPLTRVDAVMSTSLFTVPDSATLGDAWALLASHKLGQAPVVNAQGVLVGLVSRADLLRADRLPGPDAHALAWRALLLQAVTEVMWTPVPSASADTDIRRVARVLLDTGLPGLPVVDDAGQVHGFVSRTDILRAVVADPPLDLWT